MPCAPSPFKVESVVCDHITQPASDHVCPTVAVFRESAFGDKIMAAQFTAILNDNGIIAVLDDVEACNLVVCPKYDPQKHRHYTRYRFEYMWGQDYRGGIMRTALDLFARHFQLTPLVVTRHAVATRYYDVPGVPSVDVALCTRTKNPSSYRNWPHFGALKAALRSHGITYCDLSEEHVRGMRCLNQIRKARLYVGLETGVSHLASSVAAGKGLIIQSGYCPFDYWCPYGYEYIAHPVPCAPCFRSSGCPAGHACMRELGVWTVLNRILARLRRFRKDPHQHDETHSYQT
ncbi:MAG: glycosyltransferase family 9 protein [Planctomycetes bacterium]|nr:glycosyltransferase family 9 protein [Planctomycetota bacterium]